MAEKTKINDHGDVIFSEEDVIDLLYTNPELDISKLKGLPRSLQHKILKEFKILDYIY